jgi:hypothetical protein
MSAKGLSKLQRKILEAIAGLADGATNADLLERVCGWKPTEYGRHVGYRWEKCTIVGGRWVTDPRRADGGLKYTETCFGLAAFFYGYPRAPRVALSRALRRLTERGLVRRRDGHNLKFAPATCWVTWWELASKPATVDTRIGGLRSQPLRTAAEKPSARSPVIDVQAEVSL